MKETLINIRDYDNLKYHKLIYFLTIKLDFEICQITSITFKNKLITLEYLSQIRFELIKAGS